MGVVIEAIFGKYSEITAAALGFFGALALAKAPIESLQTRKALFQLLALGDDLGKVSGGAKAALLLQVEHLLDVERRWNMIGTLLIALSFAVVIVNKLFLGHEATLPRT